APRAVCAARELVSGVAVGPGPSGPLVYLTVRGEAPPGAGPPGPGRVVALHPEPGAPAAVLRLAGTPTRLAAGPAPGGLGRRLSVVEALATPEPDPPAPYRGRLLGLDPATLQPGADLPLAVDVAPGGLAIAPDGADAYALLGGTVLRLDLASGRAERLAT